MVVGQKISLKEYLELPEEKPYREFVEGEVVPKMPPDGHHSVMQLGIPIQIWDAARRAGFHLFSEARFQFGEPPRAYLPDISLVASTRLPTDDQGQVARELKLAPDLAVEILSPGDKPSYLREKVDFYLRFGVRLVLVVDDRRRHIVAHRPDGALEIVAPNIVDLAPVLPGVGIDLGRLFGELKLA